jgi:hypothetical protein
LPGLPLPPELAWLPPELPWLPPEVALAPLPLLPAAINAGATPAANGMPNAAAKMDVRIALRRSTPDFI